MKCEYILSEWPVVGTGVCAECPYKHTSVHTVVPRVLHLWCQQITEVQQRAGAGP